MSLYINSPSYYTQQYGVIDEIYKMCKDITQNINIRSYTKSLDSIGITPIIAPLNILDKGKWEEVKIVNLNYRIANISLQSNYESFLEGDLEKKKRIVLDNVLRSLEFIKSKINSDFDLYRMKCDILKVAYNR